MRKESKDENCPECRRGMSAWFIYNSGHDEKAVKSKHMNTTLCNIEQILSCTCPAPLRETQDSADK